MSVTSRRGVPHVSQNKDSLNLKFSHVDLGVGGKRQDQEPSKSVSPRSQEEPKKSKAKKSNMTMHKEAA